MKANKMPSAKNERRDATQQSKKERGKGSEIKKNEICLGLPGTWYALCYLVATFAALRDYTRPP